MPKIPFQLSMNEADQISAILQRRANEIAFYSGENRDKMPASVDYGLELEIKRLRALADKFALPTTEEDES